MDGQQPWTAVSFHLCHQVIVYTCVCCRSISHYRNQACVLSTLLYSSEAWTTYTRQEKKLNSFHLRRLICILDISWQDKITNTEVLERASSFSMYTLLSQRRLRWLGHVHRMSNGRIPKDMLYGDLVTRTRTAGHPYPRYRDTCKQESGGNRHYDMGGRCR